MVYYLRRIAFFVITLWAAITLNFIIPRIQGGDPAQAIVQKLSGQGAAVDPNQVRAVRLMLGIPNENLWQQYVDYLKAIAHGNFGLSYSYFPYTVTHMILQA